MSCVPRDIFLNIQMDHHQPLSSFFSFTIFLGLTISITVNNGVLLFEHLVDNVLQ